MSMNKGPGQVGGWEGWYIISAALDSTCSLHLLRVSDGKSAGMEGAQRFQE